MFAIHAFVLGSGLFDVVTGSTATLGQLLMIRAVFGRRRGALPASAAGRSEAEPVGTP